MNASAFRTKLGLLAEVTGRELSEPLALFWWQRYGALEDGLLTAAFELAYSTCEFFPAPARFEALLREVGMARGGLLDGASAWEALERRVFRAYSAGITKSHDWPDPHTRLILRERMGLLVHDVCLMHPAEYAETRRRFIELYDGEARMSTALSQPTIPRPRLVAGES